MNKRWSEADLRFLRDNFGKMDLQSIADRLGAYVEEVEARVEKLGLTGAEASADHQPSSFREMFKHSEAARREYEKGAAALQKKKFEEAAKHFRVVIEDFGDEKELADRARLYLAVCEKRRKPARAQSGESDDAYYAALIEKNRSNFAAAIDHLKKVKQNHDDGRAAYLLACCYARLGDGEKAVEALGRAVAEDESNRAQARRDPDFESLRTSPDFEKLTAATA